MSKTKTLLNNGKTNFASEIKETNFPNLFKNNQNKFESSPNLFKGNATLPTSLPTVSSTQPVPILSL